MSWNNLDLGLQVYLNFVKEIVFRLQNRTNILGFVILLLCGFFIRMEPQMR